MDDPMDRYLERSLKNWAAEKQPPENLRARLLFVAAAPQECEPVQPKQMVLSRADRDGHFVPLASSRSPAERMIGPFSQPRLWPLHVALFPLRALNYS